MKVSVGKEAAPDPLITFASGVGAGMGAASSTLGHQQAQKGGAAIPQSCWPHSGASAVSKQVEGRTEV